MKLFECGKIGKMELKNRIVMAAIGMGMMAEADGKWGKNVREYYIARARGGTGLITTGLVFVSQNLEPFSKHHLNLYSESHLESLHTIVEGVHQYGAKLSVQLTAGFGRVLRWQDPHVTPISASAIPCYFTPERIARPLTTEEAQELALAFGAAAKRCQMAGVDAIELHGHEGYILDQFMSGLWNQRTDKYGGSRQKRLTFPREAILAIKAEVGEDIPVIYRFGIDHFLQGGRTSNESLWIASQLEGMGVDALHVDAGCYETWWWPHPPTYQPAGCMIDMAKKVKPVVKMPIIAVGKLHYPALAEKVLQEGSADFIAIGRGLLADPDWPNKVMEGRFEDIRPCIADHEGCSGELRQGRATSCTVNPACGHEKEWVLTPVKKRTKTTLLIVGGGPAGMEAASVAVDRGFDVTLWEKTDRLGGNLWPASEPEFKRDLREFLNYQITRLKKQPVKMELTKEAIAEDVLRFGADFVIIATGALPENSYLRGAEATTAITAVDLLSNKSKVGKSVLVMGGGLIGCETAVYLAQKGHQVTLTSRRAAILSDMIEPNRSMLLRMVADSCVQVFTNTYPVQVTAGGILVKQDDQDRILPVESLVFGGGMRPCNELQEALAGKVEKLYAIGDCVEPRLIIHAIWEAFHTVRKIEA